MSDDNPIHKDSLEPYLTSGSIDRTSDDFWNKFTDRNPLEGQLVAVYSPCTKAPPAIIRFTLHDFTKDYFKGWYWVKIPDLPREKK